MAGSSDAHTDRFVHAEDSVVGRSSGKFGKLDFESISLAQFLGPFLQQLAPGQLGNTFQVLIASSGLNGLVRLGLWGRLTSIGQ